MSQSRIRLLLLVGGLILVGVVTQFDVRSSLREILDWISKLGPWGPVAFGLIYVVAAVLFLPGAILTLGAGVVFGVAQGVVIVIFSATLASTAAFLIGRYLARDWVAGKISGNPRFQAIDDAVAHEGWKIVGLTRLSPIFPYNLLNYAFGITQVSLKNYVLASFFGMLPGTTMYVYLGSLAGDLASLSSGERVRSPAEWALYGLGLLATVGVTLYVTRLARRALDQRVERKREE